MATTAARPERVLVDTNILVDCAIPGPWTQGAIDALDRLEWAGDVHSTHSCRVCQHNK